ncbi:hypothetical protein AAFF_G00208960 [Aldrovandia affinis]|uniref:Nab1 C-terminal domain-containing protein n=1 Tax=Aldrovandia affinis TaxID=143900 RepID=A0AAD7W5G7_9TELE|nr:hypothetical protein AAFF_G00208960 [Aldrovandia affinis]
MNTINMYAPSPTTAESPLNLRVSNQKHGMADRDTPLGKQLANELKRRHSTEESPTPTTETRKTENGNGTALPQPLRQRALNLSDRKGIKSEPEDSR